MKNTFKSCLKISLLLFILFISSCEKDLYEDFMRKKEKPKINLEMKPVTQNSEVISKLKKRFPSKLITSETSRGADFLLTLQGDFGRVKLDNVLELVKSNEKAFSFEVDETIKSPNIYYNLVIDSKDVIWLYKIDKITQQYKDYPLNSERLVRFKLNNDLTQQSSTPCDTIIYPPFYPDPVVPPGGGTDFPGSGNWQNTPLNGGFFPPIVIPSNPGGSSGSSSGSSSSGTAGGGGGDSVSVITAVGEAIADAWNWLVELFTPNPRPQSSGCGCNKFSNVVVVDIPENPCDEGGTIAIIPQSPVLDKIYLLNDLLGNQLGYENKMFFYNNNGLHINYFLDLAQNPPANFDINVIPDLVTHFRITGNIEFTNEIIDLSINETNQADVYNLVAITTRLDSNSNNMFEDSFALTLDPYVDLDLESLHTPPSTLQPNLFVFHTYMKYRLLRQLNPTWSKAKCAWEATKEVIHLSLDAFGLIPVVGEVADLTNGVLYTIEGDGLNATLSHASAVPIVGWASAGTKFGIKIASTVSGTTKFVWKVTNGIIEFGNRGQLRKVLNLAVGNPLVAHHIIPWAKSTNEVVQRAAKSANAFHMNEALKAYL